MELAGRQAAGLDALLLPGRQGVCRRYRPWQDGGGHPHRRCNCVVRHEGARDEWLHRSEGVQHDDVARVSAQDLSPPRHALPVTARCEARGKAQVVPLPSEEPQARGRPGG